jgi:nitric oxide synthase oxygenase domain/subunit
VKGGGLIDLAACLDRQSEAARKECRQLTGSWGWLLQPRLHADYIPQH